VLCEFTGRTAHHTSDRSRGFPTCLAEDCIRSGVRTAQEIDTAGTIGAIGNSGLGVAGVAWRSQIMALKFLNSSGSGTDLGAALAIDYSVAHPAPARTCLSLATVSE
jgi:hypothetical protein